MEGKYMKKRIAIVLVIMLILISIVKPVENVLANDVGEGNSFNEQQSSYGNSIDSVLENSKKDILYSYDEKGNRILKNVNGKSISFSYDNDSNIVTEIRDNYIIEYKYDIFNSIIGFSLDGVTYNYIKDYNKTIIAISNSDNDVIVKYQYDMYGKVSAILGLDSSGQWVDKIKDATFLGNINLIRLHSLYYDEETGLYYDGLYYYDSSKNIYLYNENLNLLTSKSEDYNIYAAGFPQELFVQIGNWQSSLLNSSTFGKPITDTSSTWFSSLTDVEILARLIYGENTVVSQDQDAVSWVLINRKVANSSTFGGNTYRGIATKSGQFEPITGAADGTMNARIPDKSSPLWSHAVWNACALLSTTSLDDYSWVITKPVGISNQLYFVGLTYFLLTGNSRNASPPNSGIEYKMSGNYVGIKDVTVVFTSYDSLQNPTSLSAITSDSRLDTFDERKIHNIFFNLK